MAVTKKDEDEALAEWRRRHWEELDKSLKVLITIRDGAPMAKDRIEAVKGITRMMGALSTRPLDSAKPVSDPAKAKANTMSAEEDEEVRSILSSRRYAKRPTD
jgi:hypothetical protein